MHEFLDLLVNLISQFAGGPGPPENNFVRFGLAAILWGVLLATAWTRARHQSHVRERLLLVGFGLALFRELFKLSYLLYKMLTGTEHGPLCAVLVPTEHALTLASVVLITGAYLRYILDDAVLAKRYLLVGLGIVLLATATSTIWWPRYMLTVADAHFHETWLASAIHLVGALLIVPAIGIMIQRRGWIGNVIASALLLLFASELAVFINFATDRAFAFWICPLGNLVYLLAIPLFGYVYYHEQQNEQLRAEADLRSYRDHLEDLVQERTREITLTNNQLEEEIGERKRAQTELLRRNAELAAQNAIAATISHSVNLDTVLDTVAALALDLTSLQHGCIFLLDPDSGRLVLHIQRTRSADVTTDPGYVESLCVAVSEQAASTMLPVVCTAFEPSSPCTGGTYPTPPLGLVVSVPLISQDHTVGMLTLSGEDVDSLSPGSLELLTAIGQQVGIAVEKTRLQHQLELAAVLEERQRIAAEMHDGLAQTLSYMGLKTDRAAELLEEGRSDQAAEVFHQIRGAIGEATYEVRRSIASLQEGPAPRLSLQETVQRIADAVRTESIPQLILENRLPVPLFLDRAVLEQVERVIQEALNNALRHAEAHTLHVLLKADNHRLIIAVEDDGHGFSVEKVDSSSGDHFGLSIMRARAARVSGELHIDSKVGVGTQVRLVIPLPEKASGVNHFIVRDEPLPFELDHPVPGRTEDRVQVGDFRNEEQGHEYNASFAGR